MCIEARLTLDIFNCSLFCQALWLNLEFTILDNLASQLALGDHLSPLTRFWDYKQDPHTCLVLWVLSIHTPDLTLVQQGLHALSYLSIQSCISQLFTGEICDYLKATSIFSTQFPLEFTSYITRWSCQNEDPGVRV